jgi:hypothetical protein
MALLRNVGAPVSIAAGATLHGEYSFGDTGPDVGVALFTPNMLDPDVNIQLIAFDHGVVLVPGEGENPPKVHYTVAVRNAGAFAKSFNGNLGNLL